jgi:hypothetical protein
VKLITTCETCPVCQTQNIRVDHGAMDGRGNNIHIEHCPECGQSYPMVCYECEHCKQAQQPAARRQEANDDTT